MEKKGKGQETTSGEKAMVGPKEVNIR